MTSGPINVSSKLEKEVGTMHRDDVGRPANVFQLGVECLHPSGINLHEQRFINHPEPAIQSANTIADEPEKQLRRVIEYRNDDCYDGHQHCEESLRVIGHPERQVPIEKRRAISVEITGPLG